jgi:hypothetical protein
VISFHGDAPRGSADQQQGWMVPESARVRKSMNKILPGSDGSGLLLTTFSFFLKSTVSLTTLQNMLTVLMFCRRPDELSL